MTTLSSPPGDAASSQPPHGTTRRAALQITAASVAVITQPLRAQPQTPSMPTTPSSSLPGGQTAADPAPQMLTTQLMVNGTARTLVADSRTTLLDALREHLDLKGSKKGCDHGQCGACTVLVEGRRINACLSLAAMHDGQVVTTIEGLTPKATQPVAKLAPAQALLAVNPLGALQAAFLKHDGFQCGYCTPGQICSAAGMLSEIKMGMPSYVTADLTAAAGALTHPLTHPLSDEEIRERMSGNICRCSAYPNIVAAIREVAQQPGAVA